MCVCVCASFWAGGKNMTGITGWNIHAGSSTVRRKEARVFKLIFDDRNELYTLQRTTTRWMDGWIAKQFQIKTVKISPDRRVVFKIQACSPFPLHSSVRGGGGMRSSLRVSCMWRKAELGACGIFRKIICFQYKAISALL